MMTALWTRLTAFIRGGRAHRRSLELALVEAKRVLGEQMVAAGIDDGQLLAQIAVVEEKIRGAATRRLLREGKAQRERLLLQLADAALEDDAPLPGADAEYQAARALKESGVRSEETAEIKNESGVRSKEPGKMQRLTPFFS